ncbi:MAG: isoprenyl transferase [Candidatus Omnitrophota bacterium]
MIPRHVAIIMDGNGRWARERGLSRAYGHKRGVERIKEIIKESKNIGVGILTLFAFSTENWSRSDSEIKRIFSYMEYYIEKEKHMFVKEDIKFNVIGRRDRIHKRLLAKIEKLKNLTKDCRGLVVNIAIDYGSRWEIVEAVRKIARNIEKAKLSWRDIDENLFADYLSLACLPDPDFLIRTSGELRISNFLLWQLAYAELYFPKVFWPDFDRDAFSCAIKEYSRRRRRFGGVNG